MKYLKYLLVLLLLLAIIVIGRGLLTPSISYESQIVVDKPVNEAWEVMQDESKIKEWLQDITDIKNVSGEKGTVGAVTEYTFNQGGQESKILETIKSITPGQQIQMDFDAPGTMKMEYKVDFSNQDDQASIKSTTEVIGDGLLMKCLIPWIKSSMIMQEDLNMSNLKNLIDKNTTNYFPEPELAKVDKEKE